MQIAFEMPMLFEWSMWGAIEPKIVKLDLK